MIGTIIIAFVGYSIAGFFTIATCACIVEARRASMLGDSDSAAEHRSSFFVGIALSLGFAILTRWLTGGAY